MIKEKFVCVDGNICDMIYGIERKCKLKLIIKWFKLYLYYYKNILLIVDLYIIK